MKKVHFFLVVFLIFFYLITLFIFQRKVFTYQFDKKLLERYFLSQDIPHEVPGKRLFLSDEEIYIATGYLYATGDNPINYNFAYPPLTKYLFGLSVIYLNNPYWVQIFFGIILITFTYFMGIALFKNFIVSFISCLFLIVDPLFIFLSSNALLDLSQAAMGLIYFLTVLLWPKKFILHGIVLGLFAATKFWPTPIIFILFLCFYNILRKKFYLKKLLISLLIAFVVYNFFYLKTYIDSNWQFNPIFFLLKIFKFHFHHNRSPLFGSTFLLFISGHFKSWWGKFDIVRSNQWSIFWPLSLISSIFLFIKNRRKVIDKFKLIFLFPLFYLIFISFQPPFTRYFIVILPFLYLFFVRSISLLVKLHLK